MKMRLKLKTETERRGNDENGARSVGPSMADAERQTGMTGGSVRQKCVVKDLWTNGLREYELRDSQSYWIDCQIYRWKCFDTGDQCADNYKTANEVIS
jgi:hypothetical protein